MIDKKSVIIGVFAGMLLGIITSVFLAGVLISTIGESFKVENMNITVALNQTQLENVIRESPGYQTARAEPLTANERYEEYDRGYLAALKQNPGHILFTGSTFEYDNYTLMLRDITKSTAFFRVMENGNDVFNGTCYSNKWCNIKNISFQIDDIHIGKEASYLVYWSAK